MVRGYQEHKHSAIIQEHHITYNPDWVVPVYKGEHWLLTQLNRRSLVSQGFIDALMEWLRVHSQYAVRL